MESFAHRLIIGPAKAGSAAFYYEPLEPLVKVEADSCAWFYRLENNEKKAFKAWLAEAFFPNNGEKYRIAGRFPSYIIERA